MLRLNSLIGKRKDNIRNLWMFCSFRVASGMISSVQMRTHCLCVRRVKASYPVLSRMWNKAVQMWVKIIMVVCVQFCFESVLFIMGILNVCYHLNIISIFSICYLWNIQCLLPLKYLVSVKFGMHNIIIIGICNVLNWNI